MPLKDQTLNHHPSAFSYHPTYCHHHFPTACWNKIHVQNHINCYLSHHQQSGAVGACWAHNPEVDGSKPSSAKNLFFSFFSLTFSLYPLYLSFPSQTFALVLHSRCTGADTCSSSQHFNMAAVWESLQFNVKFLISIILCMMWLMYFVGATESRFHAV